MSRIEINELARSRFRSYLADLKEKKGINPGMIQRKLGINRSSLHNYCSGKKSHLTLDVITAISVTYDFPYNY